MAISAPPAHLLRKGVCVCVCVCVVDNWRMGSEGSRVVEISFNLRGSSRIPRSECKAGGFWEGYGRSQLDGGRSPRPLIERKAHYTIGSWWTVRAVARNEKAWEWC